MKKGRLPESYPLQKLILIVLELKYKAARFSQKSGGLSSGPKARQEISNLIPIMHSVKEKFDI